MRSFILLPIALFFPLNLFAVDFYLSAKGFHYPTKLKSTQQTYVLTEQNISSKVKFKKLTLNLNTSAWQNSPALGEEQNHHVEANELFIDYKFSSLLRIRLGQNKLAWGIIDGYSPFSTTSSDLLWNPLSSLKRPSQIVEVLSDIGNSRLHLAYIPQQYPSLLPGNQSRWLPRELLINIDTTYGRISLPDEIDYTYLAHQELDRALKDNFGLQFQHRFDFGDIYLTHFEGLNPSPQIKPTLSLTVNNPDEVYADSKIDLQPIYYRQRKSGLAFVWIREASILRFESAYTHTLSQSAALSPWSVESVLSLEKSFQVLNKSLATIVSFYSSQYPETSDNLPISHYRLYEKTATLGTRYSFNERTSLTLKFLHQFDSSNFAGGLSYSTPFFWESLIIDIGYDFIQGADDSLLGTYSKNDQVYLQLKQHL